MYIPFLLFLCPETASWSPPSWKDGTWWLISSWTKSRHFADNIFKGIFMEKIVFRIEFHWSLVLRVQLTKKSAMIQVTTWWHHQIETFSALLALCARNSPFTGEFPSQRAVTRSFDVFFDLHLNGSVNIREAGDLRRHRTHNDATVMAWCRTGDKPLPAPMLTLFKDAYLRH